MKSFRTYMAETGQQSTLDDLERNQKFGEAEALYNSQGWYGSGGVENANGQGYSGGSGGSSALPTVEDYINAILGTLPEPPPPYMEVNPFYFDEQNAHELATAEFSPYYDELLQDYMKEVETTKTRLGEDNTRILSEMEQQKDYYVQTKQTDLDRLIRGIKQGYEGQGLYQSGVRRRDESEAQSDYQAGLQNYMREFDYKKGGQELNYGRNLEDIATGQQQYQRDWQREKDTAITGQVQNLQGEAWNEYLFGASEYYKNPDWSWGDTI